MPEKVTDFLLHFSQEHKGKLTLLTNGLLTNITLALLLDPGQSGRFERIVVIELRGELTRGTSFVYKRRRTAQANQMSNSP